MFIGFVIELIVELAIGILFTGGLLTIETLIAKLGETFKALGSLLIGAVKLPFKAAEKTFSSLAKGLKTLYEFLSKGTEEIIKLLDEVFEAFKAYSKESLSGLNSQIPLLGKAEIELYKKLITIFYNGFKNLLLEYIDIAKVAKAFEKLKAMKDLSKQDIEMMLNWRKTLLGEEEVVNVAIMQQEIKVNGELIEFEYKAFAGKDRKYNIDGFCKKPDKQYIAKQLGLTDEELMKHYETLNKDGSMRRFFDSEHKIFAQNDKDIHALYAQYGKENVQILRQNVKTLFEPCGSCKKQFLIRHKLYNIKSITVEAARKNRYEFVKTNEQLLSTINI